MEETDSLSRQRPLRALHLGVKPCGIFPLNTGMSADSGIIDLFRQPHRGLLHGCVLPVIPKGRYLTASDSYNPSSCLPLSFGGGGVHCRCICQGTPGTYPILCALVSCHFHHSLHLL